MRPAAIPGVFQGDGASYQVEVDPRLYSLDAIKKTVYRLASRTAGMLSEQGDRIRVSFSFPEGTTEEAAQEAMREFCVCLLDEDLRETITRQTAARRDILLAHAFSKANLSPEAL